MSGQELNEEIQRLHKEACKSGEDFYIDPQSGYLVATSIRLQAQGKCCESGCRHCPWRGSK